MKKVFAIAEFTIRKVEEPAFIILLAFGVICGYFVSEMEVFNLGKEYLQIEAFSSQSEQALPLLGGFVVLIMLTLLLSTFYGATDVPREIESGITMLLLGKPISRTEFLLGKYLGIVCISLLFYFLSSIALVVGHFFKTGQFLAINLILRQLLLILLIFPLTALNITFSCFFNDLSAIIISAIYLLFSLAASLIPIALTLIPKSAGIDIWLNLIYYLFPNLFFFLLPSKIPGVIFISMILYAISLSLCFLFIASVKFENKDLI
ncbi:MAG TPA: hypothetical protein P5105_01885 [Victivallales bacterium]|nr:hypothetical protein [Victivallales bacterium]HPO89531.1 hypothetical protein [Victivallales bacterium]HRR06007.1 hypothetical protein [Victivallales bacterium]HRR29170.1 hypothetical protein [Victivallales bacterium]HRU00980.1 hypothetical protein [Victivallales bacterium]